jgi:uncharacterized protein
MTNKEDFKGEIISFPDFKKIIDEIIRQQLLNGREHKSFSLVFHGGEVLMVGHKLFYKMADYASTSFLENGITLSLAMQTNATLLDDEFAKIIKKFQIKVGMSFDGIHDSNKERDIKQEVFESKFKTLENNHIDYGFLMVAGKHNIDNIKDSQNYIENLNNISSYKINYAEDMFNPGENSDIEITGEEFFEKAIKPKIDRFIETGNAYESLTGKHISKTLIDLFFQVIPIQKTGCEALFCGAGVGMIGVNPDGTSHYCDRYNKEYEETYVMNNLKDYDFLGLHQLKRAMDFNLERHNIVIETGCDTCFAKYICDGGCMAFQKSKTGKFGIDTRIVCPLFKNTYSYVLEKLPEIVDTYIKYEKELICYDKIIGLKKVNSDRLNIFLDIKEENKISIIKIKRLK